MKNLIIALLTTLILGFATTNVAHAQVGEPSKSAIANMKTEEFDYTTNGTKQKGYIAYVPNEKAKLPIILVVPEWWGYGEYVKSRARQLAELGYFAMVVDMYGDGKVANDPTEAQQLSGAFYKDAQLALTRLQSAEAKAKTYPQADPNRVGAIGYCFGGSMVLTGAARGLDFKATVSFHGGLKGISTTKNAVRGKILVCHGGADKFVSAEDVAAFKQNMDATGTRYYFKEYADATHAFTNPEATATGKKFNLPIAYNEKADKDSWRDMREFLRQVFYAK